ncbi:MULTISPECIES: DUF7556 family protein [Salinibaculum]|uniref:DUF7556 family protein n=1 Tax=Salinibaculum TaxID=2732368 RepID=UPI0030CA7F7E
MTDTVEPVEKGSAETSEVVSAVDTIDSTDHLVVADITRDDAWIAMAVDHTVSTHEWE